jgi:hypothetical protein
MRLVVMTPLTGGCNCGAVRYEVDELVGAMYCHCTRCQRRSGAAASPSAFAGLDLFRIVSGEDVLKAWAPADGAAKWFCGECGSHMWARTDEGVGIRMGTFDADPGIRPGARVFVAFAAPWEPIPDDGLQRFEERRG